LEKIEKVRRRKEKETFIKAWTEEGTEDSIKNVMRAFGFPRREKHCYLVIDDETEWITKERIVEGLKKAGLKVIEEVEEQWFGSFKINGVSVYLSDFGIGTGPEEKEVTYANIKVLTTEPRKNEHRERVSRVLTILKALGLRLNYECKERLEETRICPSRNTTH